MATPQDLDQILKMKEECKIRHAEEAYHIDGQYYPRQKEVADVILVNGVADVISS